MNEQTLREEAAEVQQQLLELPLPFPQHVLVLVSIRESRRRRRISPWGSCRRRSWRGNGSRSPSGGRRRGCQGRVIGVPERGTYRCCRSSRARGGDEPLGARNVGGGMKAARAGSGEGPAPTGTTGLDCCPASTVLTVGGGDAAPSPSWSTCEDSGTGVTGAW